MPNTSTTKSIFSIPPCIRKLFDAFPLVSYPPYKLPARCPEPSKLPQLFVWITPKEACKVGGYSFDPECLKWQTYLRFCGILYENVPSNNNACCPSTSGSLPFLIPPSVAASTQPSSPAEAETSPNQPIKLPAPIPASKLAKWARDHRPCKQKVDGGPGDGGSSHEGEEVEEQEEEEEEELDFERGDVQAFMELLDNEIRHALLYTTHIYRPNLYTFTARLYTQSSSSLIYSSVASGLSDFALSQLKHRYPKVTSAADIFAEAAIALDALSVKLGDDTWFFNSKVPGLLDAAVFAYLHVILKGDWKEEWAGGLRRSLEYKENLLQFWERVYLGGSQP